MVANCIKSLATKSTILPFFLKHIKQDLSTAEYQLARQSWQNYRARHPITDDDKKRLKDSRRGRGKGSNRPEKKSSGHGKPAKIKWDDDTLWITGKDLLNKNILFIIFDSEHTAAGSTYFSDTLQLGAVARLYKNDTFHPCPSVNQDSKEIVLF